MINLLPFEYKKSLKTQKRLKALMILEIIIIAGLVCFLLIIFLLEIYFQSIANEKKIFLKVKKAELENFKTLEEEINSVNDFTSNLNSFYKNQFQILDFIERLTEILPSKIYLNSLSYQKKGKQIDISISGVASTLEDYLQLKDNLSQQKDFKDLNFPSALSLVWEKEKDINFNISFKIEK